MSRGCKIEIRHLWRFESKVGKAYQPRYDRKCSRTGCGERGEYLFKSTNRKIDVTAPTRIYCSGCFYLLPEYMKVQVTL